MCETLALLMIEEFFYPVNLQQQKTLTATNRLISDNFCSQSQDQENCRIHLPVFSIFCKLKHNRKSGFSVSGINHQFLQPCYVLLKFTHCKTRVWNEDQRI